MGERGPKKITSLAPADPTPSPDDVNVTRYLVEAGKLLDHLILAGGRFVSLKERGLGF